MSPPSLYLCRMSSLLLRRSGDRRKSGLTIGWCAASKGGLLPGFPDHTPCFPVKTLSLVFCLTNPSLDSVCPSDLIVRMLCPREFTLSLPELRERESKKKPSRRSVGPSCLSFDGRKNVGGGGKT